MTQIFFVVVVCGGVNNVYSRRTKEIGAVVAEFWICHLLGNWCHQMTHCNGGWPVVSKQMSGGVWVQLPSLHCSGGPRWNPVMFFFWCVRVRPSAESFPCLVAREGLLTLATDFCHALSLPPQHTIYLPAQQPTVAAPVFVSQL